MIFVITKVLLYLILPPSSLLLLMAAGLVVMGRRPRCGRALVALGIVALYLLSLAPIADWLIRPLESAFPPFTKTAVRPAAVVALSGGDTDLSWLPGAPLEPSETSLARVVAGIQLAKRLRLPLVLSGGTGSITATLSREAEAMADVALKLGFPQEKLIIENRSRNTLENAREIKKVIAGRTIVLVTSAYHMKRSVALFTKQGFTIIPAPTAFLTPNKPLSPYALIPGAHDLGVSTAAISERIGLTWYRLTGAL